MDSRSLKEENMIKDARNIFRLNKLKKGTNDNTIKDIIIFLDQKEKIKQLNTE